MENAPTIETRICQIQSKHKLETSERAKEWNSTALNVAVLEPITKRSFKLTGTREQINNSWRVITKSGCVPFIFLD